MDSDLRDEIYSIEAIYSNEEDEFCLEIDGSSCCKDVVFSICILHVNKEYTCSPKETNADTDVTREEKKLKLKCIFSISPNYPQVMPEISFSSVDYSKASLLLLKNDSVTACKDLIGKPMLLDILIWLQDNIRKYNLCNSGDNEQTRNKNGSDKRIQNESCVTAILHLDHMRSKNKYLKTLEKWSSEIGVGARVIFQDRLIVIILQGDKSCVKDFIIRQKTVSVDVDSKGRSCKERMLSLLAEVPCDDNTQRLQGFKVEEFHSNKETEEYFERIGLNEHYKFISNKF